MSEDYTVKVVIDAAAVDDMEWGEFALMSDYFQSPRESGGMMRDIIAILDKLCTVSVDGKDLPSVGKVKRKYLADTVAQIFEGIKRVGDSGN